jgi:hypothetical protein
MLAWANMRSIGLFASAATAAALAIGCVVDDHQGAYGYGGSGSSSGGPSGGGPSTSPILVDVDPGRTLNAAPGQGVGVFTEYVAGGFWHVWWTCDTNKTGEQCNFDVKVAVDRDSITNPTGDQSTPNSTAPTMVQQTGTQSLESVTTTTNGIDGMRFETAPGAIITLDASMDGAHDGHFLFFVQDGAVNGNYPGTVTDPLMLEGSTP